MVLSRHPILFLLDIRVLKLGNPSTLEADQVIMVMPSQPTLVEAISPVKIVHLQEIMLG